MTRSGSTQQTDLQKRLESIEKRLDRITETLSGIPPQYATARRRASLRLVPGDAATAHEEPDGTR